MLSSAPANAVATALWKPALIVSLLFQSRGLNSRLTRMSIPTLNTPCVAINRWFGRTLLSPVPHSRPLCICTLSVKKVGITAKRRCSYSCCWSHREEIAAVAAAWLVDCPLTRSSLTQLSSLKTSSYLLLLQQLAQSLQALLLRWYTVTIAGDSYAMLANWLSLGSAISSGYPHAL